MGASLVRRSTIKRWLSHLHRPVFLGLCLPKFLVSFFTSDLSWDSPLVCTHPSGKMDLEVEASGRLTMAWHCRLTFDPQGAFLAWSCSKRGWGEGRSLNPLFKQDFVPLCTCHDYQSVYKRQTLAIYPLSVVTFISEGKQEADCKCLNWSPLISCLKKC